MRLRWARVDVFSVVCGGLIEPNGAVNLLRTTTMAGYHDGAEHYVTAFQFAGGGGAFGSITPLPGIPSSVEKGGGWSLQRQVRETQPVQPLRAALAAAGADSVQVLLQTRVDALDLTVVQRDPDAVSVPEARHIGSGGSVCRKGCLAPGD